MNKKEILLLCALSIFFLVAGCATSTETDPSKVTWGDLTRGKGRLDAHLESRRQELMRLQDYSASLESRMIGKQRELSQLDRKLDNVQAQSNKSSKELDELNKEVEIKQQELTQTLSRIQELKKEQEELNKNLASLNLTKREMDEKLIRYQLEVEQLEGEVTVLEKAIDRILLVRAKHALTES